MLISRPDRDKAIEILLLRHQPLILQRRQPCAPRISCWEKLTLLILAGKLTTMTNDGRTRLTDLIFLFKLDTLLKWHRELVRRKWTFRNGAARGRTAISPELETLILRLAKENPACGYGKLQTG